LIRDVLKESVVQYSIKLYAWVILTDHYHLLLKTSQAAPVHRFVRRLHGASAIRLNKLDGTPGRKVWYQFWDRFPRNEADFWSYFNYIHTNPIKHGYVPISSSCWAIAGDHIRILHGYATEVHQHLAQYPFSSYHYYLREHGEEFLTDAWIRYPIPDRLKNGDF
jgi:REP element-mobilizing transposase RayT